jgi:hypothetical protein
VTINVGTNIAGPSFTVDGTEYNSPQVFTWVSGSSHTISSTSPQAITGSSRYYFNSWSDSGTLSHMVAPTSNTTYTANFLLQYLLTTNVSPSGGGSINPNPASSTSDGYYNSGTSVQLTAAPNGGFAFFNWSGDLNGTANPQSLTMSVPHSVTANFVVVPGATGFVTGFALNSPPTRNNFSGLVGMTFTVGSNPLIVSSVGRVCLAGNSQSHLVELVSIDSGGTPVPGGSATVNMSGCTPGTFVYASLNSNITLPAGAVYYLVSQESAGGDLWYDLGTISTATDATVTNAAYLNGTQWAALGGPNTAFVPPDFKYTVGSNSTPAFVINYNVNDAPLRNNYTGYVGMQLTVGGTAINVSSVGRVCATGNTATHTVEFVTASTGVALSNGSASVSMAGCTPGTFVFSPLPSSITLQPHTTYYLVSSETNGADQWYDLDLITTQNTAAVNNAIYSADGISWATDGPANSAYVPVNFY